MTDRTPLTHHAMLVEDAASIRSASRTHSPPLNLIAFFLFGLVNNVIYVIFLSAADDLLRDEPNVGKSTILLADIIPCLIVKLIAPHFVRVIPYGVLIASCILCSLVSLSTVALFQPIWLKFVGIILASAGSGLGETSFLALTTYYNPQVVIAWCSGTGAAGIVGSLFYLLFSTWLDLSLRATLLTACTLPLLMALSYCFLLQPERGSGGERVSSVAVSRSEIVPDDAVPAKAASSADAQATTFRARLKTIRPLIARYIIPLFLVYYAEYVINNSVFFSLYFPLAETPFQGYRQHYPTYQALYQTGVFISRTFGRIFPVNNSWVFAIMQSGMLLFLSLETVYGFIGNIYIIFVVIFVEGLLGGAAYINTFCNITHQVPRSQVEFSMAFTGIADSTGIGLAGLTCLVYEPFLCRRNPWCLANR